MYILTMIETYLIPRKGLEHQTLENTGIPNVLKFGVSMVQNQDGYHFLGFHGSGPLENQVLANLDYIFYIANGLG